MTRYKTETARREDLRGQILDVMRDGRERTTDDVLVSIDDPKGATSMVIGCLLGGLAGAGILTKQRVSCVNLWRLVPSDPGKGVAG